jgi:hypothetical protein
MGSVQFADVAHSTQVPLEQTGVAVGQSELLAQVTQTPVLVLHTFPEGQSVFVEHLIVPPPPPPLLEDWLLRHRMMATVIPMASKTTMITTIKIIRPVLDFFGGGSCVFLKGLLTELDIFYDAKKNESKKSTT